MSKCPFENPPSDKLFFSENPADREVHRAWNTECARHMIEEPDCPDCQAEFAVWRKEVADD